MTPIDENVRESDLKWWQWLEAFPRVEIIATCCGFSDSARVIVQSVMTTAHFVSWEFANLGERLN